MLTRQTYPILVGTMQGQRQQKTSRQNVRTSKERMNEQVRWKEQKRGLLWNSDLKWFYGYRLNIERYQSHNLTDLIEFTQA